MNYEELESWYHANKDSKETSLAIAIRHRFEPELVKKLQVHFLADGGNADCFELSLVQQIDTVLREIVAQIPGELGRQVDALEHIKDRTREVVAIVAEMAQQQVSPVAVEVPEPVVPDLVVPEPVAQTEPAPEPVHPEIVDEVLEEQAPKGDVFDAQRDALAQADEPKKTE